jgi:hypothetical protein
MLAFAAKRAIKRVLRVTAVVADLAHFPVLSWPPADGLAERAHILSIAGIRRRQCPGSRNVFRTKHKSENVAMIRSNPTQS